MKVLALLLFLVFTLSGCAQIYLNPQANSFDGDCLDSRQMLLSAHNEIVIGKTKEDDIVLKLGSPNFVLKKESLFGTTKSYYYGEFDSLNYGWCYFIVIDCIDGIVKNKKIDP